MERDDFIKIVNDAISYGETAWIEFKSGTILTNDEIGEYISAMSNGATISNKSFGYIIWGISDNKEIVGTKVTFKNAKQGNQDLELWLRNSLRPKISFDTFEIEISGKSLVLMVIPSANGEPTYFKHKAYIRIGSHKTDLANYPDYKRYIYNSQSDWSAQKIEKASIADLDINAVNLAKIKYLEKNSKHKDEIENCDTITFLDKAKITIDGAITNTALLLLGKAEASHHLLPMLSTLTWKLDTEEKAYEHFNIPWLLSTTEIFKIIRNIKYKFFPDNELLATTVNKYDSKVILEALHNCIAHQNYLLNSRILVIEKKDSLIFENAGSFFEGRPEEYFSGEKTPKRYRNPWLVQAMVNLNMIDTMGYGIHSMLIEQRKRYFPLPEYDLSNVDMVRLTIFGHSIDDNYSKILLQKSDLPLSTIILLDRVQKGLPITDDALKYLRNQRLIEGRKPKIFINGNFAFTTKDKTDYIKNRVFNDEHYKDMIIAYLKKFKQGKRKDFEILLNDKLSDVLTSNQKKDKIKNIIQCLRKERKIAQKDNIWYLIK